MDAPITNLALRSLRRILRAAERSGRQLATATGLTASQLLVLQEIHRRQEAIPSAIAAALHFSQPTITALVDRLVTAGLVTRQRGERDRRQVLLRASARGEAVMAGAPDLLQERFSERFATLEPWEQAMILASLERLSDLLDATDIDAAPLLDSGAIDRASPG